MIVAATDPPALKKKELQDRRNLIGRFRIRPPDERLRLSLSVTTKEAGFCYCIQKIPNALMNHDHDAIDYYFCPATDL